MHWGPGPPLQRGASLANAPLTNVRAAEAATKDLRFFITTAGPQFAERELRS
jgi:hypothetical protein